MRRHFSASAGLLLSLSSAAALASTSSATVARGRTSTAAEGGLGDGGLPEAGAFELELPPLPGRTDPLDLDLERGAAELGTLADDTLSIVGRSSERSRVAGSAHVLDEKELERFEHDDIHRVLERVPGVYVRGEDGYGLRPNIGLRGANSDRSAKVTIMEDGVLLTPAPYSAPAAYYFPIVTRMTAVEIFKGPAAIRYGPNTIGGAMNLRTRAIPARAAGDIDLALGLDRFGKLHGAWGTATDSLGVLLEGVHLESDGFKDLDGGGDTGFRKNELMLKARWGTDPRRPFFHQLELKGGYADERSDETYLGLSDEDFEATPFRRYRASARDRMEWERGQGELAYFLGAKALDLRITAYRHDFDRAWTKLNRFRGGPDLARLLANAEAGRSAVFSAVLRGDEDTSDPDQALMIGTNDRRFIAQGVQAILHVRPEWPVPQTLELGARFHHDRIERLHTEDAYLMTRGALVPEGSDTLTTANNRGSARALSLHLLDEVEIGPLLFGPGLRLEVIDTRFSNRAGGTESSSTDAVLLPGGGAAYRAAHWLTLLAGVHRGFSPVSPGQPEVVKPESSVNYEAGARVHLERTRGELIGFFSDYTNLTGECTFSSGCAEEMLNAQFNGGKVYVGGLEALLAQTVALPLSLELRGELAYTLTLSRFRASFDSPHPQFGRVEEGDELAYVPKHQGSALAGVGSERFSVSLSAAWVGPMRDTAGQGDIAPGERIPAHALFDLALSWFLGDRDTLYAKATNLLDARTLLSRRPFGARPGPPLEVLVGYKHHFGS